MFIDKIIYFIARSVTYMPAKKQITKEKILAAAMKILKKDGMEAVNVKRLAKKLNCSTQPIYLSFSGMDELRLELASMAVQEFEHIISQKNEGQPASLYGMDYIHFAQDEPELFRFLFMRTHAFDEMKEVLKPVIERSVTKLMEEYGLDHEEAEYFHDQLWMHTHGIAAMIATGFCNWDLKKVEGMLEECQTYLAGKYEVR